MDALVLHEGIFGPIYYRSDSGEQHQVNSIGVSGRNCVCAICFIIRPTHGDPLSLFSLDCAHLFLSIRRAAALTLTAAMTMPLWPLRHHRLHGLALAPLHHRHISPAHSCATLMLPSPRHRQHTTMTMLLSPSCHSSLLRHVLRSCPRSDHAQACSAVGSHHRRRGFTSPPEHCLPPRLRRLCVLSLNLQHRS